MNKLIDFIVDALAVVVNFYKDARILFWDAVDSYEAGGLQEFVQKRLRYLSWILIGFAIFLVSTIAHYIDWETLRTEIMILAVLIGIRYSARAGL
jgi:hypothetical protein